MMNKNFADLRIKIGAKKLQNKPGFGIMMKDETTQKVVNDYESIPSELGEDQWAEIQNYDYKLYLKEQENHKRDEYLKRKLVKDTLDRQLKEQEKERLKTLQYNKRMDNIMLNKVHKELEMEKKEKLELRKKIELQKVQRDVMLLEAKERKIKEIQAVRQKEIHEVEELKKEIQKEQKMKLEKKKKEKSDALKII